MQPEGSRSPRAAQHRLQGFGCRPQQGVPGRHAGRLCPLCTHLAPLRLCLLCDGVLLRLHLRTTRARRALASRCRLVSRRAIPADTNRGHNHQHAAQRHGHWLQLPALAPQAAPPHCSRSHTLAGAAGPRPAASFRWTPPPAAPLTAPRAALPALDEVTAAGHSLLDLTAGRI